MTQDPSKPERAGSAGSVRYRVSFLEMDAPPEGPGRPVPKGFRLHRVRDPAVEDFRRLYDGVGSGYAWTDMHVVPPDELESFVRSPLVEFFLLRDPEGQEAGFFQLDYRRRAPYGVAEISYLGLLPAYCGRGIGGWLLDEVVRRAWDRNIARLDVNTCTLDHPAALSMYLQAGFRIAREEQRVRREGSEGWRRE